MKNARHCSIFYRKQTYISLLLLTNRELKSIKLVLTKLVLWVTIKFENYDKIHLIPIRLSNGSVDSTQRKIGLAELHNGLFYIKIFGKTVVSHSCNKNLGTVVSNSVYIPKKVIWHFQFDHIFLIHINKNEVCDVCHLARQRKLPYIANLNRAYMPFEMLHMDI
ncbi:hypothetical protein CR513_60638, partial [Mucuna pruriens]